MNGFFAILFITGVVSGRERMEVKRGAKVVLVEKKSGLENLSRVALYEDNADCKREGKTTDYYILNYCSPKENESGCTNKNSSTFSFYIGKDRFSLTPLNASDGYYVASITFGNNNVKKISIVVNGTLPHTISPDPPPSQENPEARKTPGTVYLSTLVNAVIIITVGIAVVIPAGILAWWCLKKEKNKESAASDCKKYLKIFFFIKSNIKAGEQTTADSFEMVARTPPSEDEDILTEVLIPDPSVGQENGRPEQLLQNNNYSEDEDDVSKHTNNYCDRESIVCSNDEDDNDDEIKSNYTNNYVKNKNYGVANGKNGGDDDAGISSGDNSSNDYLNKF